MPICNHKTDDGAKGHPLDLANIPHACIIWNLTPCYKSKIINV